MSKYNVEEIKGAEEFVKKVTEGANNSISSNTCAGATLLASKDSEQLFRVRFHTCEEAKQCNQTKGEETIVYSDINFEALLELSSSVYRIFGSKMDPALIINNFRGGCANVVFQMFGDWKIMIGGLTEQELASMSEVLDNVKNELSKSRKKL